MNKFLKNHWLFLLILFLGAALRFYRLPQMVAFDFDQEYAANFAWSVLREFPIQMIGQGLSVQGLFMGPLYFYYLTPFFAIFNLHPIGGAVGSVVLGLTIIIAYYYFGTRLFGRSAGLSAAFLRAILFRSLETDWSMVPAYSSELLVLITWYCFYQYWKGETKYLPLLGLVFGLYTSFHPILFPFWFVFLIFFLIKRVWPNLKTFILSLATFIIPIIPLIVFEYFHKFLEVKQLLNLFSSGSETSIISKFVNNLSIVFAGSKILLGIKTPSDYLLSGIILLAMFFLAIKGSKIWRESFHLVGLILVILIFVLYYSLFPIHIPEYYFLAPITLLFLYFTAILGYFVIKPGFLGPVIIFLFVLAFLNLRQLYQLKWTYPSLTTLTHKDMIVQEILKRQPSGGNFFVSYIKLPGWDFGFNYLFKFYGRIPHKDPVAGATYTIVIPKSLSPESIDISSGNVGLILP